MRSQFLFGGLAAAAAVGIAGDFFFWAGHRPAAEVPLPFRDPAASAVALDRSMRLIEEGDAAAPRDRWDPDYVVSMLGGDPQRLFAWVRDETVWIPYHGELRGPVGVLMDRQGNSLDRSLLLATLLERAGQSVRLAHGDLPRGRAVALLPQLSAARAEAAASPESNATSAAAEAVASVQASAAQSQLDGPGVAAAMGRQMKDLRRRSAELRVRAPRGVRPAHPAQEFANRRIPRGIREILDLMG